METTERESGDEKEQLLREDRRLLGRLLGDVIGEQVGAATLERIETIRQTAVRFMRSVSDPALAGEAAAVKAGLESQLDALPIEETLHVVRAFSYFSHLLNIAEDAHQNRRRRAHAQGRSPRRPGSFAYALERAAKASGASLLEWFARARVSPVLTAHPTEVQRQSILECEREIARLIALPDSPGRGPGRSPARAPRARARALASAFSRRGHLGRRRPRRQSERRPGDARTRGLRAGAAYPRSLPRRSEPARPRVRAVGAAEARAAGGAGAGGALGRRVGAPARRAVPARRVGHLQPARGNGEGARRPGSNARADRRAAALRDGGRVRRRPRADRARSGRAGRGTARRGAPARAAQEGERLRLSPRAHRPAPELRRAFGGGRRASRARRRRARLRKLERSGAHGAACARARACAPAALAAARVLAAGRARARRRRGRGPGSETPGQGGGVEVRDLALRVAVRSSRSRRAPARGGARASRRPGPGRD